MKKFGNVGKKQYIVKIHRGGYYRPDIYIFMYQVISKTINVTKDINGKKMSETTFILKPMYSNDNFEERTNTFKLLSKEIELTVDSTLSRFYERKDTDLTITWYCTIEDAIKALRIDSSLLKYESERIERIIPFYEQFIPNGRKLPPYDDTYIGAINQGNILNLNQGDDQPSLLTWSKLKKLYYEDKLKYPIDLMLDWNRCFRTNFRKFSFDPYTGRRIDWGKINDDLKEILGRETRI